MGRFVNPDNSVLFVIADHVVLESPMRLICWQRITVRAQILRKCFLD